MKWIRNILKGVSLTAALFVFQACYGTPAPHPSVDDTLEEALPTEEEAEAESEPETSLQAL